MKTVGLVNWVGPGSYVTDKHFMILDTCIFLGVVFLCKINVKTCYIHQFDTLIPCWCKVEVVFTCSLSVGDHGDNNLKTNGEGFKRLIKLMFSSVKHDMK